MKTNPFNDFWRGKEVKTEPSKIQKSDFKTLWKDGEAALAKGAMDELKNYIQLRLDQNIPQDKALDQAIAVNGRLPEMKRLDPSEVETLVEQVYNKTEKSRVFSGGDQEDAKQYVREWRKQGKSKDDIVSGLMREFSISDFEDAENFYELVTKSTEKVLGTYEPEIKVYRGYKLKDYESWVLVMDDQETFNNMEEAERYIDDEIDMNKTEKDFKEWEHFEVHYQWEKTPNKGRGDSGSESVTVPAESAEEAHRLVEENFKRIHPGYKFYFGAVVKKSRVQKADGEANYKIVRFYQDENKKSKVIKTGLTFEEAQAWCNRADTKGDGWFDGYTDR